MERPEALAEKVAVASLAQCDAQVAAEDADILLEQEGGRSVPSLLGDVRFHENKIVLGRIPPVVGLDGVFLGQRHINRGAAQAGIEFDRADEAGVGLSDQLTEAAQATHFDGAHHAHRIHADWVDGEDHWFRTGKCYGSAGGDAGHLAQAGTQEAGAVEVHGKGVGARYLYRHLVLALVVSGHAEDATVGGGEEDAQAGDGLTQGIVATVHLEVPGDEDRPAQHVLGGPDAEVERDRSVGQVGHLACPGPVYRGEGARHGEDHRHLGGVPGKMYRIAAIVIGDGARLGGLPLAVVVEVGEDGDTAVAAHRVAQGALDVAPDLERAGCKASDLGGHHAGADAAEHPELAIRQVGGIPKDVDRPGAIRVDRDRDRVGEAGVPCLRHQVRIVPAGIRGVGQGYQDFLQARVIRVPRESGHLDAGVDGAGVDQ